MIDISAAIGVLGAYFAFMAVLSVSVETFINWLKLIPHRRLQGQPSPEDVLKDAKIWLGEQFDTNATRVNSINKVLEVFSKDDLAPLDATGDVLAFWVGEAIRKHIQSERERRAIIHLLALLVGIGLATLFQIDTLELLAPLVPSTQTALGSYAHVVGIVFSGLGASAGSGFWHDQMARLRNLKTAKEEISKILEN